MVFYTFLEVIAIQVFTRLLIDRCALQSKLEFPTPPSARRLAQF
jgi:hypothetical protein